MSVEEEEVTPSSPFVAPSVTTAVVVVASTAAATPSTAAAAATTTSTTTTTTPSPPPHGGGGEDRERGRILVLPALVVDRIAAGEVVQRASAAVKELVENALDAGATQVTVSVGPHDRSFTVSDNGCGMSATDLRLACTRHATSKLRTVADLDTIQSFGFRGEALASLSMVAKVHIVSKRKAPPTILTTTTTTPAYQMHYHEGRPTLPAATPTARTVGTTIHVQDLFYNLPHRRQSPASEYPAILRIVQSYAVHCASAGIAFHCHKPHGAGADLHTSSAVTAKAPPTTCSVPIAVTKQVVAQIYGSNLHTHLLEHACALYHNDEHGPSPPKKEVGVLDQEKQEDEKKEGGSGIGGVKDRNHPQTLVYSCTGLVTSPSYCSHIATKIKTKTKTSEPNHHHRSSSKLNFILFINHRLIDGCRAIRKVVDDVYQEYHRGSPQQQQPIFVYLALTVPPHTVDVNVHPTKREVTLEHLTLICQHLSQHLRQTLQSPAHGLPPQHSFATASAAATQPTVAVPHPNHHPYPTSNHHHPKRPAPIPSEPPPRFPKKQAPHLVRTSRSTPAGALEPYLVAKLPPPQPTTITTGNHGSELSKHHGASAPPPHHHQPDCPLQTTTTTTTAAQKGTPPPPHVVVDLSLPGAFATAAAHCTCPGVRSHRQILDGTSDPTTTTTSSRSSRMETTTPSRVRLPPPVTAAAGYGLKLTKIRPTACRYTSIKVLRKRVEKHRAVHLERPLRLACFVGTLSSHRSLIQCGTDLILMNHYECARALFYQLALYRFGGGCGLARLPGDSCSTTNNSGSEGINVQTVIGQFVQMEETLQHQANNDDLDLESLLSLPFPEVSDTNQTLAEQVGSCLWQHSKMLHEYFSIRIENIDHEIRLTGLPVLLEGYTPSPHGLPLFLLRLATEVDWTEEKPCFDGVCRELGSYYAQLPSSSTDQNAAIVRHVIFPAVSTLLVPLEEMNNREFVTLTSLPKLYRVFERC